MGQDEGFLDRWSRRKLADKQRDHSEEVAALPMASDAEEAAVQDDGAEAPERHPAEDIDIDSLGRDFDFSIFLQKGVPAAIKHKALRKLWVLDPVLREPEKLTDMFNIEDTKTWGLGPMRGTSWRVGEGYSWRDMLPETTEEPAEGVAPDEIIAEAEPSDEDQPDEPHEAQDELADATQPAEQDTEDKGSA